MPYPDERAGLSAIQSIVDGEDFEKFRDSLDPPKPEAVLPLPTFRTCPVGIAPYQPGSHRWLPPL